MIIGLPAKLSLVPEWRGAASDCLWQYRLLSDYRLLVILNTSAQNLRCENMINHNDQQ